MDEGFEKLTPAGYLIKVRLEKMTYTIFKDNKPEIHSDKNNNTIVNRVPHMVFLGDAFDVNHFSLGINFVRTERGRQQIPYRHGMSRELRQITISTPSQSDLLPVKVSTLMNRKELEELISFDEKNIVAVVDEELPRIDLVQLKLNHPKLHVLIVKNAISGSKAEETVRSEVMGEANTRAVDTLNERNINILSKNPVFLSRVHLRNLDLDKVKQILFEFPLTSEDCEYISSFLETMIKKVSDPKLVELRPKLISIKRAYDFYPVLINRNVPKINEFLKGDFNKEDATLIWMLLLSVKENAQGREENEQLAKWEYQIKKLMMTN